MSYSRNVSVKHEGRSIQFTITACEIYMAGEYAGNVNLEISCDRSQERIIQECLRLREPGEDTCVGLIATGGPGGPVQLIFHTRAIACLASIPKTLDFVWCDELVASVAPTLTESVPLEQVHTLVDPLEIMARPPVNTSNRVCLAVQRQGLWLGAAIALLVVGTVLLVGPLGKDLSRLPYREVGSWALIATSIVFAAFGYWIPNRQIWFDRDRQQLLFLEHRALSPERHLTDARRSDARGYDHVRLCEREYANELPDSSDQGRTVYYVSLEGPIPYAFDDGRVHTRDDALQIAEFTSVRPARRLAAQLGYCTGLRILVASDW